MRPLMNQNEILNGARMGFSAAARMRLSIGARIRLSTAARIGLQDNWSRTVKISQRI
jgi:hypothetical protein